MARFEPKFTVAFGLIASATAWGATSFAPLVWPAFAFGVIAVSYAGVGAVIFGKNEKGRMHPLSVVVLAPYLAFAWLVLALLRLGREDPHNEIRPRLHLGRRPLRATELPKDVSLVVDLTSEFPGLAAKDVEYICLPTLDGSAPDVALARSIVERIRAHDGVTYVHCAAGHGRSAAIVASVLIAEGRAADVRAAMQLIRAARPGAGLSRSQRAFAASLVR